jgi:mono/diheme cytochrome c family protein
MFAQHGCAVCHGAEGRGDGRSAKRLDIPPGDFADPRTYRQGASPNDIAASIRYGAGAMPAFHDISDAESADIAAWIVSLHGRPRTAGGRP